MQAFKDALAPLLSPGAVLETETNKEIP